MDRSERVIYAPIRRNATANATRAPELGAQTALKYVDDEQSDGEQVERPESSATSSRNTRRWKNLKSSPTRLEARRQATEAEVEGRLDERDEQREASEDERASVEEVYLCSCCGTTSELEPAMKYLPVFRSLFVLFNCLALVFGLASLALGLWFRIDPKVYELHRYIETQNFTIAGWLMLAGGLASCILTLFVGCAANSRKSISLLLCYAISLGLLAVGSIGTLVLLTVYGLGDSLERFLTKEVYDQIRRRAMDGELLPLQADPLGPFGAGGASGAAQFIDFVQVKLRCCGALNFRDYQKLGQVIPTTCYTIAANFINAPGCGQALRELFDLRAGLAAGCSAAGALAQLLASVFAALMVCAIYNHRATPRAASALSSVSRSHSRSSNGLRSASPADRPLRPVQFQRVIHNYPPPSPLSGAPSIEV